MNPRTEPGGRDAARRGCIGRPATGGDSFTASEPADELARLAQERRAQARRRRLEVVVAQRAQIARELTKPRVRLPAEALHGYAAVDLRHHRLADLRRLARLDDQIVAVADALVDHRGAARAEREDRAPAPEARRQLERALDREGLEGQAGR